MKPGIELNGVSNMHMLLNEYSSRHLVQAEFVNKMKEQLDLLERYMLGIADSGLNPGRVPLWHDVIAHKDLFPTRKEMIDGKAKG